MDNIESDIEDIEDDEAENEEDEDDSKMPPKKKSPKKKAVASSAAGTDAIEDHLASSMGNIKINDNKGRLYNFDNKDSEFVKEFTKGGTDYVEVDVFVGGAIFDEYSILVNLTKDGNGMEYRKSTPEMFGETARLQTVMGRRWNPDDSRAMSHDNTTQIIRKNDKAVHHMHWGKPQVIPLPVKCVGKIKRTWNNFSTGKVINGHVQYISILTCRVKAAVQRTEREKRAAVNTFDGGHMGMDDQDSDSDAGDGGDDGDDGNCDGDDMY